MKAPSIHLNGTPRERLVEQYAEASGAVRVAVRTLEAASPNARDYYVQGDGAFAEAVAGHRSMLERLASVRQELEAVLDSLNEAGDGT